MNSRLLPVIILFVLVVVSCSKVKNGQDESSAQPSGINQPSGAKPVLKDLASFPLGVAVNFMPLKNEPKFAEIVKREFDQIVPGYEMKHHAIVQDDGSYNFTTADEIVNFGINSGMDVYGHTLVWHQNQNGKFLNLLVAAYTQNGTNLISNAGFENGLAGWTIANAGEPRGASSFTVTSNVIYEGSSALKVVTDKNYGSDQWKVQIFSPEFSAKNGSTYNVSFRIKCISTKGSIRLSANPTQSVVYPYQQDQDNIGKEWKNVFWTLIMKADAPSQKISFDLGKVAGTYYIDDVKVWESGDSGSGTVGGAGTAVIDSAMKDYITTMITHYKGKVRSWDVVNEPLTESGIVRNSLNSPLSSGANRDDYFFWQDYLGKEYALKAFQYAAAADPTAILFINEFNLESNSEKLDSLIKYVNELKSLGAKIDGIGTQMHITIHTAFIGIDAMFRKLAATGLKVRVSELDVRLNPGNTANYKSGIIPESVLKSQAAMYKYVVKSFLDNVPLGQRAGILVWGVNDINSWLYDEGNDYPLLYDNNYIPKPAFDGFAEGFGK